jgi:hypothetical protein
MEWFAANGLQLQEDGDFHHCTSCDAPKFKFSKKLSYGALNRQFLVGAVSVSLVLVLSFISLHQNPVHPCICLRY